MIKGYEQGYIDCYNQFSSFINEAVKMVDKEPTIVGFNKALNHIIEGQHLIKLVN
jgi:fluoride ion exporter CrcB/FEX